jgi:thymidine phosphorylase
MTNVKKISLKLTRLGIDTQSNPVIYMRKDCYIAQAEGFDSLARIKISINNNEDYIIAALNYVGSDILQEGEASLSEYAWELLGAKEGDKIYLSHPDPSPALSYIRGKIYGKVFKAKELDVIIKDIVAGHLSNIQISSFLTACGGDHLNLQEIKDLTKSMVEVGTKIDWGSDLVVDKHCVGGIPGNRTTLIVVPIIAAYGLTIPKTSSRAITSSAGTADTMEVLAPVDLSLSEMRKVVEQENGCIVWGGSIRLSPADDILIRVEKSLNLDSEGQLIASVVSKKIAAGSTHVVIDMPVGPTAKIRNYQTAELLKLYLQAVGYALHIKIKVVITDGYQPVGHGVGPALEARDILAVLQGEKNAPQDLRARSIMLAGKILEFRHDIKHGKGETIAESILDSGQAWKKFQAICDAQGGMRTIPKAKFTHPFVAKQAGRVAFIDNRRLAKVAKLAGAPQTSAAGLDLHIRLEDQVEKDQPLFTIHSASKGEIEYALDFLNIDGEVIKVK